MRAVVLHALGTPDQLKIEERPIPTPGPGDAVVRLRAAALNRRDIYIRLGLYAGIKLPIVLGSDGAGEVVDVGDGVDRSWTGRAVIIDPSFNWGPDARAQSPAFNILGMPVDGTYAEYVRVPAENLHPKPAPLSWEEAAAVPLASVTAYRAVVTRAQVQPGEAVLVTGIGGGVATTVLVMAKHLGATVYVTSGDDAKIATARSLGAAGGVNHRNDGWVKTLISQMGGRPDVVIDGAGGATFNNALDVVKAGGRVVSYGATTGATDKLEVRRIYWKQLTVLGSTMGTSTDFREMTRLYDGGLRPVIDRVLPLDEAASAHARMEASAQLGKIVLTC